MMKQTFVALALLIPISAFAQAPPKPCVTEQECLVYVLAEKLAQTMVQAAQAEAKLRVSAPIAEIQSSPPGVAPAPADHPEHPGMPMAPMKEPK